MAQPLSGLGLMLAEEKHEQKEGEIYQLLVAQRQLNCQFQHGISPVYAGSAANWLGLAICYTPLHGVALGLPRMALSSGCGCCRLFSYASYRYSTACRGRSGREPWRTSEFFNFLTLSRVVARQLGLLAQVRYPARGSVRMTP